MITSLLCGFAVLAAKHLTIPFQISHRNYINKKIPYLPVIDKIQILLVVP